MAPRPTRAMRAAVGLLLMLCLAAAAVGATRQLHASPHAPAAANLHKIKHVVVIMQENRSFDNYFGTYPGADGLPMQNGVPTVCLPSPKSTSCVRPYHDRADLNLGGPHGASDAIVDFDGGKMD